MVRKALFVLLLAGCGKETPPPAAPAPELPFQELGAFGRLHRALFEALYVQGRQLQTIEDIADVAALAGIDRATFLEVAVSPKVEAALESSRAYTRAVGVTSTPSLIVAGRYRVERNQPGSAKALQVADWLLENTP